MIWDADSITLYAIQIYQWFEKSGYFQNPL